jgi:putative hydrolase of HD superfamily
MRTKAPLPLDLLSEVNSASIVKTYFEFNHLKQLYRQGWLLRGVPIERCESVAEHSFGVALLSLFLADTYFPQFDKAKIVSMALIHDFGEIYAGDFTPSDNVQPTEKQDLERQSVVKVLQKLANGSTYIALWEEFESGESPEARFVRQIDRLEMGLQASVYSRQNLVDPSGFFISAMRALQEPQLQSILKDLENLS